MTFFFNVGEFSWTKHFKYEVTRTHPETVEMWCLLTAFPYVYQWLNFCSDLRCL